MPKYVVRYGSMRHLGVFSSSARDRYARGHRVIARTDRGQEVGEVLCEATEHVLSQMGRDYQKGQILRPESHDDAVEMAKLGEQQDREFAQIETRIAEFGLDMKLVKVERLYGGERVIVFYLAEQRVDFRQLVKTLAKDLQTRVEMRQIGVRDEAKLLADYGDCGKPVCCNTHLSEMPPVSMKMAKLQKATLDPTKISGRCGRLKCCLRYEYDTYTEMQQELPRVGYEILTREGKARVLSQSILTSELLIQTEEGRRITIPASEVVSVIGKATRPPKESAGRGDSAGPESGGRQGAKRRESEGEPTEATKKAPGDSRGKRQRKPKPPRNQGDEARKEGPPTSDPDASPPPGDPPG